jgi:hypothetical protein
MNDAAQQWLTAQASVPGILACGLLRPDGQSLCDGANEACPPAIVEKILTRFETLTAATMVESSVPYWSTWAFEQGQVRLVERPDGWRLAVVARNEPTVTPVLDQVSEAFLAAEWES